MGVSIQQINPSTAARYNPTGKVGRLRYAHRHSGSPADAAGIRQGDIIVRMGDQRVQ